VRCQPSRSKKATRDDLIYVGNAGWRTNDAVAPSFLVKVRVCQSQRDAVEQHKKSKEAADRAGAEAGAGAAGCKLSDTAGGETGKAGRGASGADDAMDFEGDEAGGEADGKAAADLSEADRCGAGGASGCEVDGEARGAGGGESGEAGREVGDANDGTGGDETGGEANRMLADVERLMAARIVAHIVARTPNLAMCAASCSPSSVRWVQAQPLQPLQPLLPLRPLHPLHSNRDTAAAQAR